MRFNGTGRTKVYHIFINIMREGALRASKDLAKTRQSKTRSSRKGLVSLVALASAPLRKNNVCAVQCMPLLQKNFFGTVTLCSTSHTWAPSSHASPLLFSRDIHGSTSGPYFVRFYLKKKQYRKKYIILLYIAQSYKIYFHAAYFLNDRISHFLDLQLSGFKYLSIDNDS